MVPLWAICVFLGIHAAAVCVAFCVMKELERIRRVLERQNTSPTFVHSKVTVSSYVGQPPPVYSIWVCIGRRWELDPKSVPAGYVPGPPPSFPGSFENQKVKTECRRC